jgi:membrane fusion protein, heavy metal efflux system
VEIGGEKAVQGRVEHVGDVLDVETRSAVVRVVVANGGGLLRPGQSAHARIHTRGPAGRQLVVPRTVVTRVDGKAMLFVALDPSTVEPRTVTLAAEDGEQVAIATGVEQGDQVVSGGLFALKSEIFR